MSFYLVLLFTCNSGLQNLSILSLSAVDMTSKSFKTLLEDLRVSVSSLYCCCTCGIKISCKWHPATANTCPCPRSGQ